MKQINRTQQLLNALSRLQFERDATRTRLSELEKEIRQTKLILLKSTN